MTINPLFYDVKQNYKICYPCNYFALCHLFLKGEIKGCVQVFPLFYLHPINNCYWSFNYAPVIAELWLTCVIFFPGDAL